MKAPTKKLLGYLLLIFFLGFGTVRFVVQRIDVCGDSMEPVYSHGDILLVEKFSIRFSELKRFETVVFQYQYGKDQYYIKRIVGLPGETVQIIDGRVWINGTMLEDPYGKELMKNPRRGNRPVVLGADEYFVLGDNRNDSSDSRDFDIGNVSKTKIIGRTAVRVWKAKREHPHEKIK